MHRNLVLPIITLILLISTIILTFKIISKNNSPTLMGRWLAITITERKNVIKTTKHFADITNKKMVISMIKREWDKNTKSNINNYICQTTYRYQHEKKSEKRILLDLQESTCYINNELQVIPSVIKIKKASLVSIRFLDQDQFIFIGKDDINDKYYTGVFKRIAASEES
ncbi:hypothetical protein C9J48_08815 [Photobacterium profundum]|nr:hypothetical protein [Photobacterium profundum]PSV63539.1 hypothetical protein C9J48_08815 [Photobacterium profundum]